jgi:hypothetical protein
VRRGFWTKARSSPRNSRSPRICSPPITAHSTATRRCR